MNGGLQEIARGLRPAVPHKLPERIDPRRHEAQPATIWVRSALALGALLCGALLVAALYVAWLARSLGEPVPNYSLLAEHRLERPVTAFNVVTDRDGRGVGLLVADSQAVHYGEQVKDLLHWRHVPLAELQPCLPAPDIVGLSAHNGKVAFVCEDGSSGCRALAVGTFATACQNWALWPQPIVNATHFPGLDDLRAHCLLREPQTGLRLVGARGIGVYDPVRRSWGDPILQQPDGLSSGEVFDLDLLPGGGLAVSGSGGIDFGTLAQTAPGSVAWKRTAHHDRASGLVGTDVRQGRVLDSTLVYVTAPGGLGCLELDAQGQVRTTRGLIGEGRAPGLTRASLQLAAQDRPRAAVWMIHQAADKPGHLAAALYRTDGHDMAATPAEAAWPATEALALTADEHAATLGAWIGGKGLRHVTSAPAAEPAGAELQLSDAGLPDRLVDEIALDSAVVVVHAQREKGGPAESSHTMEAATRRQLAARDGTAWSRPFIGPRRFPNATLADFSAACEGQAEGQSAIWFGTKDKGLAAFLRGTRELSVLHHTRHPDPAFRVPCDGSLDLAARGPELFQVGANRTLAYHDGTRWTTLIAENGIGIDPADVKTVVADGKKLVIGAANKIGAYDTDTHQWSEIPPVAKLKRLAIGIDRLWALDADGRLSSYPLRNPAGQTWAAEYENVKNFYADSDLVAVLRGSRVAQLQIQTKGGGKAPPLVAPQDLARPRAERWQAAAAEGGTLYIAPHNQQIGRYDLTSHKWQGLPFPAAGATPPKQLLATPHGLWLLGGDNGLYFLAKPQDAKWETAAQNVKWLGSDGTDVILLGHTGSVQRSQNGIPPLAPLVGDAFADDLAKAEAAVVYKDSLFVGTAACVGRYQPADHSWHNYQDLKGTRQFAYTANCLYALTADGEVKRWSATNDGWEDARLGAKNQRLAASGGPSLFVLSGEGKVLAVPDLNPGQPTTLLAATRLERPGRITAGAEMGSDLCLGCENGQVWDYGKTAGQPRQWARLFDGGTDGGPIRQLLAPPGAARQLVAVGKQVWLLAAGTGGGNWTTDVLLDQEDISGAVDQTHFYGLQKPGSDQSQIWRVALNQQPFAPIPYFGKRFPESQAPQTAAVGVGPAGEVFRADESGQVAQYDFTAHGWQDVNLKVREFFRVGRELWAWVPDQKALYWWQNPRWQAADKQVEHVVGDGQELLVAKTGGAFLLRTANGDTTLVPALPVAPLPLPNANRINAAAEQGEWLLLAQRGQPLLAYHRGRHEWRVDKLTDVAEFCLVSPAAGAPVLFARTGDGGVQRWDGTQATWLPVTLPANDKANKLVAAGDYLAIGTDDGKIHAAGMAGQVTGSYQPQPISGRKASDFRLRAAAEQGDKLLLIPDLAGQNQELWAYDPDAHGWKTSAIQTPGRPAYFLEASGPWLVLEHEPSNAGEPRKLSVAPVTAWPPAVGNSVPDLLDVATDDKSLWAITPGHRVRHVDRNKGLVESGIPENSLPAGRQIHRAFAMADQCGVLLDDGSIYHYARTTHLWEQRIPPLPANVPSKGQLVRDEERRFLLVRSDQEIWSCDVTNGAWQQLPAGQDITALPKAPAQAPAPDWEIVGPAGKYQYFVQVQGKREERQLEDGRFDWDLPRQIVAQAGDVWLKTDAGPRHYHKDANHVWQEVLQGAAALPNRTLKPLAFEGNRFACRQYAPGAVFPAAPTPVTLLLKLADKREAVLKPGENATGAGFAHDIVRDLAAADGDLWLATAGGAVRLTGLPNMQLAEIEGPDRGLKDDNLAEIAQIAGKTLRAILVKSQTGAFAVRRLGAPPADWSDLPADRAEPSFRRLHSIERYNDLLQNWQLCETGANKEVLLRLGTETLPITVGPSGFGFDRPQAFAFTPKSIRAWTADGKVELPRAAGPLSALDPAQKAPHQDFADVLDDPQAPWLRECAGQRGVWQFRNGAWQRGDDKEFAQLLAQRRPLFWDDPQLQWDRQDQVTCAFQTLNRGERFTTWFDVKSGRFLLNLPYDMAVFGGELWAVTAGGIVRFGADKQWDCVLSEKISAEEKLRLRGLTSPAVLVLEQNRGLRIWDGKQWGNPANAAAIQAALARQDQYLIDGATWRLERAAAQQRDLEFCPLPAGAFHKVVLGDDGVFDFERVADVADDGAACLSATEFGLHRIDAAAVDFTHLWKQASPAERLGRWQQKLYARLRSGQELEHQGAFAVWTPNAAASVFPAIAALRVATAPWFWSVADGKHRVRLQAVPNGIWQGKSPLAVGLVQGRFDFDTVHDVGLVNQQPWLVTAAGLVARQGPGWSEISQVVPFTPAQANERSLLSLAPLGDPRLFARSGTGLLRHDKDAWVQVAANETTDIQNRWQKVEAESAVFQVGRGTNQLAVGLHLPEDPAGRYKLVDFDAELGLFTFDVLAHVTRQAGDPLAVLVGTTGGVARFELNQPDALRRLYCDSALDGIGRVQVQGILLAKREPGNLLAAGGSAGGRTHYLLNGDRWQEDAAAGGLQQRFELERRTVAYDPQAWQVVEVDPAAAGATAESGHDLRWRGQTVRLANLKRTGDAAVDVTRFAHDVPLSAAVAGGGLWLGTRGGVVRFPLPSLDTGGGIPLDSYELYADATLPAEELRGSSPPRGVVLLRSGKGAGAETVWARRADGTVLRHDRAPSPPGWDTAEPTAPEFQAAAQTAVDSVWSWVKDGRDPLAPVRLDANRAAARVPADYVWLTNGTWSFLETGHCPRQAPRRTAVGYRGRLYLATAGGVTRFSTLEASLSGVPGPFVDAVFAVAGAPGQETPMLPAVELLHDTATDQLYARSAGGQAFAFDADGDAWSPCPSGQDPFSRPRVLVDNPLLKWSWSDAGWEFVLRPLAADLPDQSQYPLFSDGKFAFDYVRAFALQDGQWWLATDGGVCTYTSAANLLPSRADASRGGSTAPAAAPPPDDRSALQPARFFARTLAPAPDALPGVREIVADRGAAARMLCRCRRDDTTETVFELASDRWQPATDESPFVDRYQRDADSLMRFIQYPAGCLEAHLLDRVADDPPVVLGTARGRSPLPLFAHQRFAFDDIQAAVIDDHALLAASSAGVVEHQLDWNRQAADAVAIRCYATPRAAGGAMGWLTNLARFPADELLAWSNQAVFRGSRAPSPGWAWAQLPGWTGQQFQDQMLLPDREGPWVLARNDEQQPRIRLFHLPAGQTEYSPDHPGWSLARGYVCSDASVTVMDERWIYQRNEREGGLIRVSKAAARRGL